MEKIINSVKGRQKPAQRVTRNSKLFKAVINGIQEKKGESIVSLDLKKIDESVADFFVICEAQSHTQVKAIAENIVEKVAEDCGERPYHVEHGPQWTLVDYVNVVVHIFQRDYRVFYDLESLWADAEKTAH
ncbi:MAG TPA: ribosome silencing factor [Flavipsychrobacter sp.]|nr:ribosome silencing factor [Flavipsychrobacter sp.]